MIIVPDSTGFEVLCVVDDRRRDYRPQEDTLGSTDMQFLWSHLPDDLEDLPTKDKRVFEEIWAALYQSFSTVVSDLAYTDQSVALLDFPLLAERKWLLYEFQKTYDLRSPGPEFTVSEPDEPGSRFLPAGDLLVSQIELLPSGRRRGGFLSLKSPHTSRDTFRAQIQLRFFNPADFGARAPRPDTGPERWVRFGFRGPRRRDGGAQVAVSTTGRVALLSHGPGRVERWELAAESLPAQDLAGFIQVGIWVTGAGPSPGVEALVSAGTTQVYLRTPISAPMEVTECGVYPPDTLLSRVGAPSTAEARGPVTVELDSITLFDATVAGQTQVIPCLRESVTSSDGLLQQDVDFEIHREGPASRIRFYRQPPPALWAEHTGLNLRTLEKNFAPLVGNLKSLSGEDSPELLNRIVGCLHGLLAGPQAYSLALGVSALTGTPLALWPGVVAEVTSDSVGPYILVRNGVRSRKYRYVSGLRPLVRPGDSVRTLQPMTEGAEIVDWTQGEKFLNQMASRLEPHAGARKFSALLVDIPTGHLLDAVTPEAISDLRDDVRSYLESALAVWVSLAEIIIYFWFRVDDRIEVTDAVSGQGTIALRSALTDVVAPIYNQGKTYDGSFNYNAGDAILQDQISLYIQNAP